MLYFIVFSFFVGLMIYYSLGIAGLILPALFGFWKQADNTYVFNIFSTMILWALLIGVYVFVTA